MGKKEKNPSRSRRRKPDIIKKNGAIVRMYPLTVTETKIAKLLVGKEMSNKEISAKLGVAIRTIENHRFRIMRKLEVRDGIALTKKILRMGLVKL